MRLVETGVTVTPADANGVRPAGLRFVAGPTVIPATISGLVTARPVADGANNRFMGELSSEPKT